MPLIVRALHAIALTALLIPLASCSEPEALIATLPPLSEVDVEFVADPASAEDLDQLAEILRIAAIPMGELAEPDDAGERAYATVYYPMGRIADDRFANLRIDVNDNYDGDGALEFRTGDEILDRQPFDPENSVTVQPVPDAVVARAKPGTKMRWGLVFDGDKASDSVTTTFEIVDGTPVRDDLEALETSPTFQRQPDVVKELMRARVFLAHRLYTDAVLSYHTVLGAHDDLPTAVRGLAVTLSDMGLTYTDAYRWALDTLRSSTESSSD